MGRRHRLLQEHRGDRGRGGQGRGRMKYKEIQFLRVTWFSGILSHGMALAVASECLHPAPLHPGIP